MGALEMRSPAGQGEASWNSCGGRFQDALTPSEALTQQATSPRDDLAIFLGDIPADEREQRERIRQLRNAAAWKMRQTHSRDAGNYCWIATDVATAWIYAPTDVESLTKVATYLRRLLVVAGMAEDLEVSWEEQQL